MIKPYDEATAGQPITALRWNNLQTQIRTEVEDLKANKLNIAGGTVTGALLVNRAAEIHKDPLHLRGSGNAGLRIETGTAPTDLAALRFQHGEASTGWIATASNGRMSFSGAMHLVAGRLGLGIDAPGDTVHLLQQTGTLAVRLQNGATPADWNLLRFFHGNAQTAFIGTHGANGRFTVSNALNVLGNRVGVGPGTENAIASTLDVRGELTIAPPGSPGGLLVNHKHVGWSSGARDRAEISVDPAYKTLMLVGSISAAEDDATMKWPGTGRRVSVWDRLEVNGHLWTQTFVAGLAQNFRPFHPIHTTAIAVDNGIIQRGGAGPLGGTADLGLYSQVPNNWIRIVTAGGGVTFRSDGGIGTVSNVDILPTGDLKVRRWALAAALGVGIDTPGDLVHVKGAGNIGLRIEANATANDFAALRFVHGGQIRATVSTNNAGLNLESPGGTITATTSLQVKNGAIIPAIGNAGSAGIQFPINPGGGGGDEAFIRYHIEAGETTTFRLGVNNDPDDSLRLFQHGADRLIIQNGQVTIGSGTAYTTTARALNVQDEIKSFGGSSGLRMSDRAAAAVATRDWVIYPDGYRLNFWQGEAGNVAFQSKETFYTPRLSLPNGVIQRGGDPLTATNDLGLYSQVDGHWIRFVTRGGNFAFFADGGIGAGQIARIEANGNMWLRGRHYADGGFNGVISDLQLKTDIEPLTSSLARLLEIRGVSFRWTDESRGTGRQIGLVAQDVEAVFPEAVDLLSDGYRRLDYTRLVAPLIEAVREQQQQIGGLRRELAELRERIA